MDLNMWEMFREIIRLGRGAEGRETPRFTMAFSPHGTSFHNMVMVRDAVDTGELLSAVRDFYVSRGRVFSIWVRDHADAVLEASLRAHGFMELVSMPGMVLLGDPGGRCEPAGLEVRPATTEQGRRDYLRVTAESYATFQQPRELTEDCFVALESVCAPHVQGFVGYAGGEPVAAAAVYVTHGVAGIGWVGTVPAHRGHGYAEAVTWAAVREGFRRGGAFANLQASPMGRPVYERMGFMTPTHYRVLVGTL
jgi:GNAT superfamily N-acetyltransferase